MDPAVRLRACDPRADMKCERIEDSPPFSDLNEPVSELMVLPRASEPKDLRELSANLVSRLIFMDVLDMPDTNDASELRSSATEAALSSSSPSFLMPRCASQCTVTSACVTASSCFTSCTVHTELLRNAINFFTNGLENTTLAVFTTRSLRGSLPTMPSSSSGTPRIRCFMLLALLVRLFRMFFAFFAVFAMASSVLKLDAERSSSPL
mmetsp:Transcript_28778/g.55153  ORF Transcript_28778/g.55153 Transcript_28778/m.55153 type:complete len:208 (-) Transcript_28778:1920-2543(-)